MATACALDGPASRVVREKSVVTFFQPILSGRQRSVAGMEALSRGILGVEALSRGTAPNHAPRINGHGPAPSQLIPPGQLFAMAEREGVKQEMERLCRQTAIRTFSGLQRDDDLILFLNFDASLIGDGDDAAAELLDCVQEASLTPNYVAIEVIESQVHDVRRLRDVLCEFRERGFLLVLDDVGSGHSNLDRIPLIKPDVLKMDRGLVSHIQDDYHKQETFKAVVHLARRIGALVVAEGVETQEEGIACLELGADFLQGFLFGRPQPGETVDVEFAARRVDDLAREYKAAMIRRINDRKLQHRKYNILLNQVLCELARAHVRQFDQVLARDIQGYQGVECIYVLDESGKQISSTVWNPSAPKRSGGVMFRPAPLGADHSLKEYYYVLLDVELQKYTTDPYVSLASGNVCRTISTVFRDAANNKLYILCIDVLA